MCPYFDFTYKKCAFFDTYQEGYQKEHYCLSEGEWKRCINYTNRSLEEKLKKRLRPNPEF